MIFITIITDALMKVAMQRERIKRQLQVVASVEHSLMQIPVVIILKAIAEIITFVICQIVFAFVFKNHVDDAGEDRGETLQIVMINSFKMWTTFNFEFTADYNYDLTPGLDKDHYVELSLVKPITPMFSINVQRVISTFEPESVNQFGFRLSF